MNSFFCRYREPSKVLLLLLLLFREPILLSSLSPRNVDDSPFVKSWSSSVRLLWRRRRCGVYVNTSLRPSSAVWCAAKIINFSSLLLFRHRRLSFSLVFFAVACFWGLLFDSLVVDLNDLFPFFLLVCFRFSLRHHQLSLSLYNKALLFYFSSRNAQLFNFTPPPPVVIFSCYVFSRLDSVPACLVCQSSFSFWTSLFIFTHTSNRNHLLLSLLQQPLQSLHLAHSLCFDFFCSYW